MHNRLTCPECIRKEQETLQRYQEFLSGRGYIGSDRPLKIKGRKLTEFELLPHKEDFSSIKTNSTFSQQTKNTKDQSAHYEDIEINRIGDNFEGELTN